MMSLLQFHYLSISAYKMYILKNMNDFFENNMPDVKNLPDPTLSQSMSEAKVPESTSERMVMESLLEDISLECVLADITDTESFTGLFSLLKKFFQKAKDCNFLELAEDAKKAGKIVKTIMEHKVLDQTPDNNSESSSDNLQDIESQAYSLNQIISEMKSFLHFINQSSGVEDIGKSSVTQPSDTNKISELSMTAKSSPQEISKSDTTDIEVKPRIKHRDTPEIIEVAPNMAEQVLPQITELVAPDVKSGERNLIHPGELPAFLNIDDFAEFLSLQKNTLDKMEVLILDIEKENNRAYAQGELKRLFHTTKGEAGFLGLKDVERVCHRAEDLMDTQNFGNIVDLLLAVKDWLDATYNIYAGSHGSAPSAEKIIEMFDQHNNPDNSSLPQTDIQQKTVKTDTYSNRPPDTVKSETISTITSPNSDSKLVGPNTDSTSDYQNNSVTVNRQNTSEPEEPASSVHPSSLITESINVDAARLDRMVNIIGEIAIAESMVTQSPEIKSLASPTLLRALSSLHKITRELQTLGLSLRMVPLKSLFNRMDRVVRDLARKTGKKIQFIIRGESTELDKTIVDKLGDPLIHLVRNSVDHGIEESIRERVGSGKPETATIELRAFHKGGYLFIEVEDDGRGVNRKRLEEKAIAKGIITAESLNHGDKTFGDEILNLVFHPGLTTASKVTDVSGRGVGMDVVRKSIEACRGKVSISSTEGKGTICAIKIPLTLSIIDGLVVRVAKEIYVIPTLSVVTSLKVDKRHLSNVFEKGEMINVLGKLIPLFRLNRLFKIKNGVKDTCNGIIVVVEDNGLHTALLVDELMGKQNTVIKNLGMGIGMGMDNIKGISGGTIMPDGRVSLILDIAGIIELSHAD